MKVRKKPVEVEGIRWEGFNLPEIEAFFGDERDIRQVEGEIYIETPRGTKKAEPGDWIIKDLNGVVSVMPPPAFALAYDVLEEKILG